MNFKRWNHYVCEVCRHTTIARHDDEGVTPFMVNCRAMKGCHGMASSTMFRGSQADDQVPHIVFFRPKTRAEAMAIISRANRLNRVWLTDHYDRGGALMRDARS